MNGYANALQYYVIRKFTVLFIIKLKLGNIEEMTNRIKLLKPTGYVMH